MDSLENEKLIEVGLARFCHAPPNNSLNPTLASEALMLELSSFAILRVAGWLRAG
jgi:hypothetical protein